MSVVVVGSSLILALDSAGRLEDGLATVIGCLDRAADVLAGDARTAFVLRAMESVIATARLLRQHVFDSIGSSTEEPIYLQERAVRARINVIMRALRALAQYEDEVPSAALTGRFGSLRDVRAFLIDQVTQIYARWAAQRATDPATDAQTRNMLAYAAVDDAEIGFALLGRDDSLAHFLHVGAESSLQHLNAACREIAAAVGATITHARAESPEVHLSAERTQQDASAEVVR